MQGANQQNLFANSELHPNPPQLSGGWLPTATAHPPALELARWEGWLYQQPPQRAAVIIQHAIESCYLLFIFVPPNFYSTVHGIVYNHSKH